MCLKRRLLPRWNSLPLLAGIWLPVSVLFSLIYETITGVRLDLPEILFLPLWFFSLAGFAGTGYLLQLDTTSQQPNVEAA